METSKELYIVDENGEILDSIKGGDKYVKLSDGDKVVRRGVLAYLNDTADVKYRFVKINPYVYGDYANKYPILNQLVKYVGYMDGILCYKNGKKIKSKDIYKVCGVSLSTAKRQLKGLMEDDIIHKVNGGKRGEHHYVLNPYVAYIGKKIYLSLYEEFKLSEHRLNCEEWSK